MDKVYVIAGPTASGKTAYGIHMAKELGGEVISADSMQVYQGMDIGTATPTPAEMDGIPHHMLSIVSPREDFSVKEYTAQATQVIQAVLDRGKTPIIVGGTGFYINALIKGTSFEENPEDMAVREQYLKLAETHGVEFVHQKLQAIDPAYAKDLHPNNVKKVVRAIAFYETTGTPLSAHNASQKADGFKYDVDFKVIAPPREVLYARIDQRVIHMWEDGLVGEVEALLAQEVSPHATAMQAIGYKEVVAYINGTATKADTIAQIQQASRNYGKRQETWFRHQVKTKEIICIPK